MNEQRDGNAGERAFWRFLAAPLILAVLIFAGACSGEENSGGAKSAILFVGDGMGTSHRSAIRLSAVGLEGSLEMDSLPYSGLSRTRSAGASQLTDSAAGATAIASGVKTYNDAVGVDASGREITTLLEQAKRAGKSVGLVTTSQVTDATPAAFAAHVTNRARQGEIARQYIEETKPDVILGGGGAYWRMEEGDGSAEDSLAERAERLGYDYVTEAEELGSANGPKILGLFADEQMFEARPEGAGAAYDPAVPLPQMARKAIEVLSSDEEGFFLLVEEEAIDEMSHANNAGLTLEAGRQFDEAVGIARDYAEDDPNTLLVVAADHETGGLSIDAVGQGTTNGLLEPGEDGPLRVVDSENTFSVDWTTNDHTAEDVPITATGPGAEAVEGVYENTHLHDAIRDALLQED